MSSFPLGDVVLSQADSERVRALADRIAMSARSVHAEPELLVLALLELASRVSRQGRVAHLGEQAPAPVAVQLGTPVGAPSRMMRNAPDPELAPPKLAAVSAGTVAAQRGNATDPHCAACDALLVQSPVTNEWGCPNCGPVVLDGSATRPVEYTAPDVRRAGVRPAPSAPSSPECASCGSPLAQSVVNKEWGCPKCGPVVVGAP